MSRLRDFAPTPHHTETKKSEANQARVEDVHAVKGATEGTLGSIA